MAKKLHEAQPNNDRPISWILAAVWLGGLMLVRKKIERHAEQSAASADKDSEPPG